MFILLEVQWVDQFNQPEARQRIRHIGGDSMEFQWQHTEAQAIEFIERGEFAYFVKHGAGSLNLAVGHTADGGKYLTISADGGQLQTLLDLPGNPCPAPAEPAAHFDIAVN
jgi:Protein of unknown function (DUF3892)